MHQINADRRAAIRLTRHTDYALRILLHLAASNAERTSIALLSDAQGLPRNHVMKVVHQLGLAGFIVTVRGKGGGFALARPASEISLGDVVRVTEADLRPADCGDCLLQPACGLSPVLGEAVAAFMAVLDRYSVADAVMRKPDISALVAALMDRADG